MARYSDRRSEIIPTSSNEVLNETPPTTASSSEAVEMPDFMLWVKEEPFVFGILSPQTCPKIALNVLRKVAEYCREKDGYYPRMNMFEWGHLSKYKLQISTDLSWAYFRLFDIISKPVDINNPMKNAWDLQCESIRLGTIENFDEVNVDTLKFLVFLYIQNYLKLHKNFSARPQTSTSDDTWPLSNVNSSSSIPGSGSTSCPGSPRSTAVLKRRCIPEQIQAEFVVANLADLIDFLNLTVPKSAIKDDTRMPLEIVAALSLIMGAASINPLDREFKSLEESLLVLPEVTEIVDYDQKTNTLSKNKFVSWVKTNLKLNPWGPTSTPVPQHRVECVTGIWEKTKAYELNRVYWNTQLYPKGWFLISSVDNQVIYLEPEVPLASLKVHRCNNSFIYVPGPFNSVIIDKCRNSTIFLGAAAKVVRIVDCSNVSFSGAGRVFILCDNYKSTFHLLTPCQPIICGSKNRRINLAPYNTFYPKLEEHLNMVSLGLNIQKWNKPLEFGPNGIPLGKGQTSNHTFLRPEKFNNFIFPFEMEGSTTRNPVELPSIYSKKLQQMRSKFETFRELVHEKNFNDEEKSQLNAIVTARFQKWLKEKGHLKELKGLRSMQKSIKAGSSFPLLDSRKSVKSETVFRKGSVSIASLSLENNDNDNIRHHNGHNGGPKLLSSRGSGDLSNGAGGGTRDSSTIPNGDPCVNKMGSVTSSISLLNGMSSGGSGSFGGSGGRPGTMSDSEDEVFLYEGDDFGQLDSVFFSDGEDTDGFQNEDFDKDEHRNGNGEFDDCMADGYESDNTLIFMPMDDGLLWKPI